MFIQWTGRTRIKQETGIRRQETGGKPKTVADGGLDDWELVRGRILAALARYPEAERAVMEAFQKEDEDG